MLDQEYLDAVKRFNHEIYPKIGVAQSFVTLMPKVMKDIARECGEDSYPCRRLKSVGWDQVQDTLMKALEELEMRERRRIPRPSIRWVKPNITAYAYVRGEVLRLNVVQVSDDSIICYGGSNHNVIRPFWKYTFTEKDIDSVLFRTEYELLCSVLKPGTPVWCVTMHKELLSGNVRVVEPPDQDAEGAIIVDFDERPSPLFVRYEDFDTGLFLNEQRAREKAGIV